MRPRALRRLRLALLVVLVLVVVVAVGVENVDAQSLAPTPIGLQGIRVLRVAGSAYGTICAEVDRGDGLSHTRCYGDNSDGLLGAGDTIQRGDDAGEIGETALVDIDWFGSGTPEMQAVRVVDMDLGGNFGCAILNVTTDDANHTCVKCWGYNMFGSLGIETSGPATNVGDTPTTIGLSFKETKLLGDADLAAGVAPVEVSLGVGHGCVRFSNERMKCWGVNFDGALGLEDSTDRGGAPGDMGGALDYVKLPPSFRVKQIDVGNTASCAVYALTPSDSDPLNVTCWGSGQYGQLGTGGTDNIGDDIGEMSSLAPIALGVDQEPVQVSCGNGFMCVLLDKSSTSSIKCFGLNGHGQLGQGHSDTIGDNPGEMGDSLDPIDFGTGLVPAQVSTGDAHACAVFTDGSSKCWGRNSKGQLGQGNIIPVGGAATAVNIISSITLAGRAGDDVTVHAFGEGTCALWEDGSTQCWGDNQDGQLGLGHVSPIGDDGGEMPPDGMNFGAQQTLAPTPYVFTRIAAEVDSLSVHETGACALTRPDNTTKPVVVCWGSNSNGQLGAGTNLVAGAGTEPFQMGQNLTQVKLGSNVTAEHVECASTGQFCCVMLRSDITPADWPRVKCWGHNDYDQLGLGAAWTSKVAVGDAPNEVGDALPFLDFGGKDITMGIDQLSLARQHVCALFNDGCVVCWGDGNDGRLGYGSTTGLAAPPVACVALGSSETAVAIAAGFAHTCALLTSGNVKCWGANGFGQLGYDDTIARGDDAGEMGDSLAIVHIGAAGLSATALCAGERRTCIIRSDSQILCWGDGSNGQLGSEDETNVGDTLGSMTNLASNPPLLGLPNSPANVSCGGQFTCVLDTSGSFKCFGANARGQLGLEDTDNRGDNIGEMGVSLPFPSLPFNVIPDSLCLAGASACALSTMDEVYCWGRNSFGQLGQGDTADRGDSAGEMGSAMEPVNVGPVQYASNAPSHAPTMAPTLAPTGDGVAYVRANPGSEDAAYEALLGDLSDSFASLDEALGACAGPATAVCDLSLLPGEHNLSLAHTLRGMAVVQLQGVVAGISDNGSTVRPAERPWVSIHGLGTHEGDSEANGSLTITGTTSLVSLRHLWFTTPEWVATAGNHSGPQKHDVHPYAAPLSIVNATHVDVENITFHSINASGIGALLSVEGVREVDLGDLWFLNLELELAPRAGLWTLPKQDIASGVLMVVDSGWWDSTQDWFGFYAYGSRLVGGSLISVVRLRSYQFIAYIAGRDVTVAPGWVGETRNTSAALLKVSGAPQGLDVYHVSVANCSFAGRTSIVDLVDVYDVALGYSTMRDSIVQDGYAVRLMSQFSFSWEDWARPEIFECEFERMLVTGNGSLIFTRGKPWSGEPAPTTRVTDNVFTDVLACGPAGSESAHILRANTSAYVRHNSFNWTSWSAANADVASLWLMAECRSPLDVPFFRAVAREALLDVSWNTFNMAAASLLGTIPVNGSATEQAAVQTPSSHVGAMLRNNAFASAGGLVFRSVGPDRVLSCPSSGPETYLDDLDCDDLAVCTDLTVGSTGVGFKCVCEAPFTGDPFEECTIPPGEIRIVQSPVQMRDLHKTQSSSPLSSATVSFINVGASRVDMAILDAASVCNAGVVLNTTSTLSNVSLASVCSDLNVSAQANVDAGHVLLGASANNHNWTLAEEDGDPLDALGAQVQACSFATGTLNVSWAGLQQASYFLQFVMDSPDDSNGAQALEAFLELLVAASAQFTQVDIFHGESGQRVLARDSPANWPGGYQARRNVSSGSELVLRVMPYDMDNVSIPNAGDVLVGEFSAVLRPSPNASAKESAVLEEISEDGDEETCDSISLALLISSGTVPPDFGTAGTGTGIGDFPSSGVLYFVCEVHPLFEMEYTLEVNLTSAEAVEAADVVTSLRFPVVCGSDYVQRGARCTCPAGYSLGPAEDYECEACASNAVKSGAGDEACTECGANSVPNEAGSACVCADTYTYDNETAGSECVCKRGHQFEDNGELCEACPASPAGSYKDTIGNGACTPCSLDHQVTMAPGATSEADCVCAEGYYLGAKGTKCVLCDPDLLTCTEAGVTTQSLLLQEGYWRSDPESETVLSCPVPAACLANSTCLKSHTGPYCAVCEAGSFESYGGLCKPCSAESLTSSYILLAVLAVLSVSIVYWAWSTTTSLAQRAEEGQNARGHRAHSLFDHLEKTALRVAERAVLCCSSARSPRKPALGEDPVEDGRPVGAGKEEVNGGQSGSRPAAAAGTGSTGGGKDEEAARSSARGIIVKFKIAFVFFQVVLLFQDSYLIAFPPDYLRFLDLFSFIQLDWFRVAQVECAVDGGFGSKLLLSTLLPLAIAFTLLIVWLCSRQHYGRGSAAMKVVENTLINLFLVITYVLFPSLATTIFSTFVCEKFDDGTKLLRADYSISCASSYYKQLKIFASFMILVYPIGIPALYAWLLLRVRDKVNPQRLDKSISLAQVVLLREENVNYLKFLYDAFKPKFYWMEVFECFRKLALTGFVVFLFEGSALQIYCGILVSVLSVMVYCYTRPYLFKSNNYFSMFAHTQITITLIGVSMLRYNQAVNQASADSDLSSSYANNDVAMLLIISNASVLVIGMGLVLYSCFKTSERDFLDAGYIADGKGGYKIDHRRNSGIYNVNSALDMSPSAGIGLHDEARWLQQPQQQFAKPPPNATNASGPEVEMSHMAAGVAVAGVAAGAAPPSPAFPLPLSQPTPPPGGKRPRHASEQRNPPRQMLGAAQTSPPPPLSSPMSSSPPSDAPNAANSAADATAESADVARDLPTIDIAGASDYRARALSAPSPLSERGSGHMNDDKRSFLPAEGDRGAGGP